MLHTQLMQAHLAVAPLKMHALLQAVHLTKVLPLAERDPHSYVCVCTYTCAAHFGKALSIASSCMPNFLPQMLLLSLCSCLQHNHNYTNHAEPRSALNALLI